MYIYIYIYVYVYVYFFIFFDFFAAKTRVCELFERVETHKYSENGFIILLLGFHPKAGVSFRRFPFFFFFVRKNESFHIENTRRISNV